MLESLRRRIFRGYIPDHCEWGESCRCTHDKTKANSCHGCQFYFWWDSASGYCRSLPQPTMVAWCKDTCSFFRQKGSPT